MNDRKLKILAAVVDEYIRTGEPVGSKAISKLSGINVSAATIRNDMAALEQLGYLEQPHTSAGRIPTFLGYRLYIDELMDLPTLSDEEKARIDSMLGDRDTPEELLIQNAGGCFSDLQGNSYHKLQRHVFAAGPVLYQEVGPKLKQIFCD